MDGSIALGFREVTCFCHELIKLEPADDTVNYGTPVRDKPSKDADVPLLYCEMVVSPNLDSNQFQVTSKS